MASDEVQKLIHVQCPEDRMIVRDGAERKTIGTRHCSFQFLADPLEFFPCFRMIELPRWLHCIRRVAAIRPIAEHLLKIWRQRVSPILFRPKSCRDGLADSQ